MKTRKLVMVEKEVGVGVCCGQTTVVQEVESVCCEQPTDGSSCCDNSDTRENNSLKTGCC
ncbi:MAG: hypothetical protein IPL46_22840 [Saprospiraceae bacterium]|nr:hypothetical protein [Saprospiraceae bacterium]